MNGQSIKALNVVTNVRQKFQQLSLTCIYNFLHRFVIRANLITVQSFLILISYLFMLIRCLDDQLEYRSVYRTKRFDT